MNWLWIIGLTALAFSKACFGEVDVERTADAIKIAEGVHSRFPYGIKSVRCEGEQGCRKVCIRTLRNNLRRWKASGDTRPYIAYLGAVYAPISDSGDKHHLNNNWIKNVTAIYNREKR